MRVLNFMLGLLIGAILGAGVVLLTTPQSGEDVQRLTREKMDSLLNEGRRAFETRKAELEKRMTSIQAGIDR